MNKGILDMEFAHLRNRDPFNKMPVYKLQHKKLRGKRWHTIATHDNIPYFNVVVPPGRIRVCCEFVYK